MTALRIRVERLLEPLVRKTAVFRQAECRVSQLERRAESLTRENAELAERFRPIFDRMAKVGVQYRCEGLPRIRRRSGTAQDAVHVSRRRGPNTSEGRRQP